jgi:hypothetical protein
LALELIEGAVDALKTYLSDIMAAKAADLNIAYADGIEVEDMKAWYIAYLPEMPEFPACVVLGKSGSPEGEGSGWMKGQHAIDLIVLATDQNTENLQRKLYRYIRALIELVTAARASIGYQINIGGWDFSDTYASQSSFLSGAKLTVYLKKYENT